MLHRRGQPMDSFSPCSSSNQKRLGHVHHPTRWAATTESEEDEESRSRVSSSTTSRMTENSNSNSNSEMVMMMLRRRRRRDSSFGSCGGWSIGSLMEKCPTTPSPICSPVSSLSCSPPSDLCYYSQVSTTDDFPSFATPNQSCTICNDTKNSASPEEEEEEEEEENNKMNGKKACNSSYQPKLQTINQYPSPMMKMREGDGYIKQHLTPKAKPTPKSTRSTGQRILCESSESFTTSNDGDDGRLPAVREEQEERGCNKDQHPITRPSHLSSDDDYYTGSSGNGSRYENSDTESVVEEHLGSAPARTRPSPAFNRYVAKRNEVEAKLMAWKEARTLKLMNKLRKEEAEINEWEINRTTKAKMEMKEFEMKLEKKREKAMEKMQRRIRSTQKKAEKKKLKERASASKKISRVTQAFEKMAETGKLPCMLIFL